MIGGISIILPQEMTITTIGAEEIIRRPEGTSSMMDGSGIIPYRHIDLFYSKLILAIRK